MTQTNNTRQIFVACALLALTSSALPQTPAKSPSLGVFDIVKYERSEVFAGKLGNRVSEKLTLKQGEKTYTLSFGRYHTRVSGQTSKPFCPGCPIEIKKGRIVKNEIRADRRDVIQLHEKDKEKQ
jgi:hypothetical protein